MSLQNPNDCFGMYRSSDSYIQGTADYNRWLNCELNKEFISAQDGLWNQSNDTGRTKDGIVFNEFGGGGVTGTNTVDNIIKTVTETASNTTSETATNTVTNSNQTIQETASKNPLLTIGVIFGIAFLLFKK